MLLQVQRGAEKAHHEKGGSEASTSAALGALLACLLSAGRGGVLGECWVR